MNREFLEELMQRKGVNPTAMRLLTLDFLLRQHSAVSLSEIEKGFPRSDRITLYRTLKTFAQKGLVHGIQDGPVTKYALCEDSCTEEYHKDAHLHFLCRECGRTFCLPGTSLPSPSLPKAYRLEELQVLAKGLCEECARKEPEATKEMQ